MQLFNQAVPVWSCAAGEKSDQYRLFRKKFTLPENPGKVMLHIAADSTYMVKINGTMLNIQQLADFPGDRTVTACDISTLVNGGENIIAVEVHYIGERFLTYRAGEAFICAEIINGETVVAATGEDWKCCTAPDYQSGLDCKMTSQLGFVFALDARQSVAFDELTFDDSMWNDAVKVAGAENWKFSMRQIPGLLTLPRAKAAIKQMGYVKRDKEQETFAITAFRDYLAPRRPREFFSVFDESELMDDMVRRTLHCKPEKLFDYQFAPMPDEVDGYYVVLDCGRELVGFLDLELYLPDGAIVDICHGEHLDDGRVRTLVGPRNFADRLIARGGWNKLFYTHRRIGGRFVELHITNCRRGEVMLRYAGITPLELPLTKQASFVSEDRLLKKINEVSVDTLKLCMHEHYEDCPWREQGLYPYDSRNQILYGYYLWGNYNFVEACLDLLGKSYDGKRYLELTSPGYTTITIPVFTMVWITELYEYYLFSGSDKLTKKWLGQVDSIIDAALAEEVENMPGLYHSGTGSRIWNFSEWNGELSSLKEHPQAPYNVYFVETLRSAAKLHESQGNMERAAFLREKAEALGKLVDELFFNETQKFYNAVAGKADRGYEHIQAIMLANELVPLERQYMLHRKFNAGDLCGIDFSALYYLVTAMMKGGVWTRKFLTDYLRKILEPVVLSGATSLWETRQGADDFGYAGSLCHGWSSVMPYFCGHCLLGVTPLSAGFKTFEVKPYAADLSHASGSVPTPSGMIFVSWKKEVDGLSVFVRHPAGLECVPGEFPECKVAKFTVETYTPVKSGEPLFISHRGESIDAPENTLPAFALSAERKTGGMECDVRFTADGQVVCSHDGVTTRVSGESKVIAETDYDDLKKVDVSNNKAGFEKTPIPLFADTLKYVGNGRKYFVEIKVTDPAMPQAVIDLCDAAGVAGEDVIMISFEDEVVKNYKMIAPDRKALLLIGGITGLPPVEDVIARLMECNADGVDIFAAAGIDQDYVDAIHHAGYDFAVWTVDDEANARRFYQLGVDAITSNCAGKLLEALQK